MRFAARRWFTCTVQKPEGRCRASDQTMFYVNTEILPLKHSLNLAGPEPHLVVGSFGVHHVGHTAHFVRLLRGQIHLNVYSIYMLSLSKTTNYKYSQ